MCISQLLDWKRKISSSKHFSDPVLTFRYLYYNKTNIPGTLTWKQVETKDHCYGPKDFVSTQ